MEKITLINGTYSKAEAADILFSVLDDKIRYHNVRILSYKERFGMEETNSKKRLAELLKARDEVSKLLKAQGDNVEIKLSSEVEININVLS